jgi:DNA-binding MarR family transcriptional regulator
VVDLTHLFDQLVRFETELWNAVDARLRADCGLPLGWFEALRVVRGQESCRVHDVAARLAITVGGTSKLVDRVEAAGYCRRRSNPDDRRSSIVELTPEGERVAARAATIFQEELRLRLGSALPEPALRQLGAALTELRSAGHRVDSERTA